MRNPFHRGSRVLLALLLGCGAAAGDSPAPGPPVEVCDDVPVLDYYGDYTYVMTDGRALGAGVFADYPEMTGYGGLSMMMCVPPGSGLECQQDRSLEFGQAVFEAATGIDLASQGALGTCLGTLAEVLELECGPVAAAGRDCCYQVKVCLIACEPP